VRTAEWIREFKIALGDLGRDVMRAYVLGDKVSVSIDLDGVGHTSEYNPRSDLPALSAAHFQRQLVRIRERRGG
jgi:hypothetical protein